MINVLASETFSAVSAPIQYAAIKAFQNDHTKYIRKSKNILSANKNFKAPEELKFNLPGKAVIGEMDQILDKLYNDKVILDHGVTVAKELAHVLSGGDTTIDKTLTEDDLFKLELDAFMRLIETQKTQDRIKHTLATGKPLVN